MVWDPSNGAFGQFDLAALLWLPHLCLFVCLRILRCLNETCCKDPVEKLY